MTLLFSEKDHRYYFVEAPDVHLTSVSTLIGKYHEKFDRPKMLKSSAAKQGVSEEQLSAEWDEKNRKSIVRGSMYHQKKEHELLGRPNVFRHPEVNGLKQAFDITELKPGVYPELILYHPAYNIVGTADLVEIFSDGTFFLSDHKTNEKLEFTGYPVWNKATMSKEPKKMFQPVAHLDDCKGMHYTLQLSSYAFMLEEAGYECKGLQINHVIFDEDESDIMVIPYPINYLKKEVKHLFEHHKRTYIND